MSTRTLHSVPDLRRLPAATSGTRDLDRLAHDVAERGVEAHLGRVMALALTGRERGVELAILDVVADDTASYVARQRAFGQLARALGA